MSTCPRARWSSLNPLLPPAHLTRVVGEFVEGAVGGAAVADGALKGKRAAAFRQVDGRQALGVALVQDLELTEGKRHALVVGGAVRKQVVNLRDGLQTAVFFGGKGGIEGVSINASIVRGVKVHEPVLDLSVDLIAGPERAPARAELEHEHLQACAVEWRRQASETLVEDMRMRA